MGVSNPGGGSSSADAGTLYDLLDVEGGGASPLAGEPPQRIGIWNASKPQRVLYPRAKRLAQITSASQFTAGGSIGITEDTSDPIIADRSVVFTSPSNDGLGTATLPTMTTPVDLSTGYSIHFPVKVSPLINANVCRILLSSDGFTSSNYHRAVITQPNVEWLAEGEWFPVGIAITEFAAVGTGANLSAINRIRFEAQRSGGISFTMQVGWVDAMPITATRAKCVFWFDDTLLSGWTAAARSLSKYAWPATLALIPKYVEWDQAGAIRMKPLRYLNEMHHWQVGGHAYSGADHGADLHGDDLERSMQKMFHWHRVQGFQGVQDGSYYGAAGIGLHHTVLEHRQFARRHYRTMRTTVTGPTNGGPYTETLPIGNPMATRAYLWGGSTTFANVQAYVDRAIAAKSMAQFVIHNNFAGAQLADFESLLAYLDTQRSVIDVCTIDEAISSSNAIAMGLS